MAENTEGVLKMRSLVPKAIVAILAIPVVIIYDLNGHSFDLTGRQAVLVVSDSMDGDDHGYAIDSFPADSLAMVQHIGDQEKHFPRIVDAVSHRFSSTLVQHRVAQVENVYVYLHEDSNTSAEKVMISDINGKIVGTDWVLGHLLTMISSNLLAFPALMFAIGANAVTYAIVSDNMMEVAAE